jgi:hypothetical protein
MVRVLLRRARVYLRTARKGNDFEEAALAVYHFQRSARTSGKA